MWNKLHFGKRPDSEFNIRLVLVLAQRLGPDINNSTSNVLKSSLQRVNPGHTKHGG